MTQDYENIGTQAILITCEPWSKWGIPERDISSLHAMGWGSGQMEKLSARRRRRRRRRHLENAQI